MLALLCSNFEDRKNKWNVQESIKQTWQTFIAGHVSLQSSVTRASLQTDTKNLKANLLAKKKKKKKKEVIPTNINSIKKNRETEYYIAKKHGKLAAHFTKWRFHFWLVVMFFMIF